MKRYTLLQLSKAGLTLGDVDKIVKAFKLSFQRNRGATCLTLDLESAQAYLADQEELKRKYGRR